MAQSSRLTAGSSASKEFEGSTHTDGNALGIGQPASPQVTDKSQLKVGGTDAAWQLHEGAAQTMAKHDMI